ncbi:serine/threonine-protein kinase [Sorangium atrum]|uniref:Protein kinase n=1 Tax=Sorangium atrum TaxID=2995308 RepID=A0ABT5CHH5_9BACT|nr:serine/threonine-protein kinase [Sorangium aterium]MDC0685892.1 protein kinase [Sorangium aterium]
MMDEHHVPGQSGWLALAGRGDESTGGVSSSVRGSQRERAVGEVLAGKYQIVGRLGAGGMGTVWRARSLWLDVDVAIKVLHEEQLDAHAAERLLREARATAKLGHPAIVRVFDFGETDAGEPFLVMELLEGTPLSSWIEARGRVPAEQAVQMLLPVACALATAHAQRIVHRDIKPANILIVPDGAGGHVPKVVDFGIAKLANAASPAITQRGMIVGSPEYMSPEQADGQLDVGEQTDVWAFSVVMYELITGRRPFSGETLSAVIVSIFSKEPVPTTELGAGDEALWAILRRGLAKSPADRWPSMRALGRALAAWAIERGVTADVAGTSLAHQWLARGAEPPLAAETAATIAAPAGATSGAEAAARRPAVAREAPGALPTPAATPIARRGSTIEMPKAWRGAPLGLTPPPWLQKALVAGVLAFAAPLVVVLGLDARGGRASAGTARTAVVAAAPAVGLGASEAVRGTASAASAIGVAPPDAGARRAAASGTAVRGAPTDSAPPERDEQSDPWEGPSDPWDELLPAPVEPHAQVAEPPGQRIAPRAQVAEPRAQVTEPRARVAEPRAPRAASPRPRPVSTSMPLPAAPDF